MPFFTTPLVCVPSPTANHFTSIRPFKSIPAAHVNLNEHMLNSSLSVPILHIQKKTPALLITLVVIRINVVFQAAVERQKEDAEKEEEAQIKRWESTVTTIMQLRCEGVTDEAKWMEVTKTDNYSPWSERGAAIM